MRFVDLIEINRMAGGKAVKELSLKKPVKMMKMSED